MDLFTGPAEPQKKFGAATNKQKQTNSNVRKLENDSDYKIKTVSHQLAQNISWGRTQSSLTQTELATLVRAIKMIETAGSPLNNDLVAKIENVVGFHLRGQNARQPKLRKEAKKTNAK